MAKPTKEQKRKAKLKARKQQAIHNQQSLTERLSIALEKLCDPILPEYIDDSRGPDCASPLGWTTFIKRLV